MIDYYPLVIETAIEVRHHVRMLFAHYEGKGKLVVAK